MCLPGHCNKAVSLLIEYYLTISYCSCTVPHNANAEDLFSCSKYVVPWLHELVNKETLVNPQNTKKSHHPGAWSTLSGNSFLKANWASLVRTDNWDARVNFQWKVRRSKVRMQFRGDMCIKTTLFSPTNLSIIIRDQHKRHVLLLLPDNLFFHTNVHSISQRQYLHVAPLPLTWPFAHISFVAELHKFVCLSQARR